MASEPPPPSSPRPARSARVRQAVQATGRGVRASGRGVRVAGVATGRAAGYTYRQARRATHADGAGDSGMYRLIEMHAFGTAGDAALAISLAGTLFFQVPTGEARSQVALFLGLTMLPFVIVTPLIGPFLDRFAHGRRWAIGATMGMRAFLCWVLAGAVEEQSPALFAAALGCLVCSKAYGVTRAAAVPRLLPERLTLVRANSRVSLAGVAGVAVSAPIAVGLSRVGPSWSLRYAFVVFVIGTVLAILLPAAVDSSTGERRLSMVGTLERTRRPAAPASVVLGLRCNAGLRLLSGFFTLYLAFLLRTHPLPGWSDRQGTLLALVVGAAGLGNTVGIGLGTVLRAVRPEVAVLAALAADLLASLVACFLYGLPAVLVLGLTAGVAQGFAKLSLDALIQRDVPDDTRSSTFARSETLLQLSWVLGGFIGIALPLIPRLGLGVASALLLVVAIGAVAAARRMRDR